MSTVLKAEAPTAPALETAIALDGEGLSKDILVWGHLKAADVLFLGYLGSDDQIKTIIYYTAPSPDGGQQDVMPVFTRLDFALLAKQKNPKWSGAAIIETRGGDLLEAVEVDAIVINPWSHLEYRVPRLMTDLYNHV